MTFTKFTVSESVETAREQEREKISAFVKEAGKNSVEELDDEQKEQLQARLTNR